MIREREIKMFEVNYECDVCHSGNMIRNDNLILTSYPPQYSHKCSNCGAETYFQDSYPLIKYEKDEKESQGIKSDSFEAPNNGTILEEMLKRIPEVQLTKEEGIPKFDPCEVGFITLYCRNIECSSCDCWNQQYHGFEQN